MGQVWGMGLIALAALPEDRTRFSSQHPWWVALGVLEINTLFWSQEYQACEWRTYVHTARIHTPKIKIRLSPVLSGPAILCNVL